MNATNPKSTSPDFFHELVQVFLFEKPEFIRRLVDSIWWTRQDLRSILEQIFRKISFEIFLPLKFLDLSCCQSSVPYDGDMKDDVLKRVGISRTFEENALKALATSSKTLEKLSLYYVCLSGKTKIKLIRKLCLQNGRTLKVCSMIK